MSEYVEREALIEWLKRIRLIDLSDGRGLCRVIMEDDFKKAIKKMPKGIIADVATVRHGRIVGSLEDGRYRRRFSCCGEDATMITQWAWPKYCPSCGAKMDGGAENA